VAYTGIASLGANALTTLPGQTPASMSFLAANAGPVTVNVSVSRFGANPVQAVPFTVTVNPGSGQAPAILGFSAAPAAVASGQGTTLSWSFQDPSLVTQALLTGPGNLNLNVTGQTSYAVPQVTGSPSVYTMTVTGPGGGAQSQTTVTLLTGAPVITAFQASSLNVPPGTSVTLSWATVGADSLVLTGPGLDPGGLVVSGLSSYVLPKVLASPSTYTLAATGPGGQVASARVILTVSNPPLGITAFGFTQAPDPGMVGLTASFSDGTGNPNATGFIDPGGVTLVNTGVAEVNPPTGSNAFYTLTVTNPLTVPHQSVVAPLFNPVQAAQGSFDWTQNLRAPRKDHSATLLPNGYVLLAGGWQPDPTGLWATPVDLAEMTAPADAGFSSPVDATDLGGYLGHSRAAHTATLLLDGTVLVAGGYDPTQSPLGSAQMITPAGLPVAPAEIYNPVALAFQDGPAMNAPRFGHTATLMANGQVLIVGGQGVGASLPDPEIYDPAAGSFQMPTPQILAGRTGHTATLLPNGQVLVAGGLTSSGPDGAIYLFDPPTGKWSQVGSLATPRYGHAAVLLAAPSTRILFAGGTGTGPLPDVESFDYSQPQQVTQASRVGFMSDFRPDCYGTLLSSGRVLLAGGGADESRPVSSADVFDPVTGYLTQNTDAMSEDRARGSLTPTGGRQGQIQFAGGGMFAFTTELFTPAQLPGDPDSPRLFIQVDSSTSPLTATASMIDGSTPTGTLIWFLASGTLVSGTGTNQITFNPDADGMYVVSVLWMDGRGLQAYTSVNNVSKSR
jgi:hypothetical protein